MKKWQLVVINYAERLVWTFVIAFVSFTATRDVLDYDTAMAAAMAGLAAVLTFILAILTDWVIPSGIPVGLTMLLRVFRTWIVAVLTVIVMVPPEDLIVVDSWKVALVASWPVVLSTIKNIAVERTSADGTPATLPRSADLLTQSGKFTLGA